VSKGVEAGSSSVDVCLGRKGAAHPAGEGTGLSPPRVDHASGEGEFWREGPGLKPGGGGVVQWFSRVQLYDPMNCSAPGFSVLHHLPEFAQTHVR